MAERNTVVGQYPVVDVTQLTASVDPVLRRVSSALSSTVSSELWFFDVLTWAVVAARLHRPALSTNCLFTYDVIETCSVTAEISHAPRSAVCFISTEC